MSEVRKTKKARINEGSLSVLRMERNLRVGELRKMVFEKPIHHSEIRNVFIEATVVEFKMGRQNRAPTSSSPSSKHKSPFVFVTLADCTGTISVGANLARSGLEKFCLDPGSVTDASRCFFQTKISGDIYWSPKRDDNEQALVAIRGTFSIVDETAFSAIDNMLRMSYATSDVMEQVLRDPYADTSKFTTSNVIGKIATIAVISGEKKIRLQLEDPVGYVVVEISNVMNAEEYLQSDGLAENECVIVRGELEISEITPTPGNKYACVRMDTENILSEVVVISSDQFQQYVGKLCLEEMSNFSEVQPSPM